MQFSTMLAGPQAARNLFNDHAKLTHEDLRVLGIGTGGRTGADKEGEGSSVLPNLNE